MLAGTGAAFALMKLVNCDKCFFIFDDLPLQLRMLSFQIVDECHLFPV